MSCLRLFNTYLAAIQLVILLRKQETRICIQNIKQYRIYKPAKVRKELLFILFTFV